MFICFEVTTGKMLRLARSEFAANLFVNFTPGTDYVNVDDEFDYQLRSNPEWEFIGANWYTEAS